MVKVSATAFAEQREALNRRRPTAGASETERKAWTDELRRSLHPATYVSFKISPVIAVELARRILALVEPDGRIKEPRSIRVLKPGH